MKKAWEIQKMARDNASMYQTYITDLQNWEAEMKRKEAAISGDNAQILPPVRSKLKKEKPVQAKKKLEKRISASDYGAWDKFDVDKACEDIDMAEVGPVSLDSKNSEKAKLEKLKEEAQYEKERGNLFVKQEKWDEAIACYNRAIELVKDDAIYYANRGLCFLKKDRIRLLEALKLDPTYVKALQRRATARERLGSLRAASHDLMEVIKLEPNNAAARLQLEVIRSRMGTKGTKYKSSPVTTPTTETKLIKDMPKGQPKIVELPDEAAKELSAIEKWITGEGEGITVMKPVKKPPHLRSKRALKTITIQEIPLGKSSPEKPPSQMKIMEIDDEMAMGDTNNNDSDKIKDQSMETDTNKDGDHGDSSATNPETFKAITEACATEGDKPARDLVAPVNSVQFMSEWKYLKGNNKARSDYLSIIQPSKMPAIFANALESDVLSEIIQILNDDKEKFRESITAYLMGLTEVKRFSALAMFLSPNDKKMLNELLEYCKAVEQCSEIEFADLKNKFEI